ncbi:MAG: CapA family protein [Chloroflexi bacterium]|nr:CapA family protein [Chloroflexota bacterium]
MPVTQFRSPLDSTSLAEVQAVLAGTSDRYAALALVEADADAILAALGVARPADPARLVVEPDAAVLAMGLAEDRKRLAFLRADQVDPSVRALAWGRHALFGVDRVSGLDAWTLFVELPVDGATERYDPAAAWTLVAGGDILLDRGVYKTVKIDGKGVDFPFDGGTAEITSRYCCSSFGWELPRTERTGNAGAMRALLQGADLAIANFENPAPNDFSFHTRGTSFTADPSLIDGLARAGLDWVSLANNHIRDAGGQGILETIDNLEARGLRHGGAGADLDAAREPSLLDAGGTTVAILAYDAIAADYAAAPDRAGSAPLSASACQADARAARAAGAEVVIVFPHWGVEYDATPFDQQQGLARACLDAGADMIIGNHAHWAGALEIHDGKPIWYALGNFVFDQTWSEPTMEGITVELTFQAAELRQARMRPHIILDKAQPNFLEPNGDGAVVMGQIFEASEGLLDW